VETISNITAATIPETAETGTPATSLATTHETETAKRPKPTTEVPGQKIATVTEKTVTTESTSTARTEPVHIPMGPEDFGYGGGIAEITEHRFESTTTEGLPTSSAFGLGSLKTEPTKLKAFSETPTPLGLGSKLAGEGTTGLIESTEEPFTGSTESTETSTFAKETTATASTELSASSTTLEAISRVTMSTTESSETTSISSLETEETPTTLMERGTEKKEGLSSTTGIPAKTLKHKKIVSEKPKTAKYTKGTLPTEVATTTTLEEISTESTVASKTELSNAPSSPQDFGYGGGKEGATGSLPVTQQGIVETSTALMLETESKKPQYTTETTAEPTSTEGTPKMSTAAALGRTVHLVDAEPSSSEYPWQSKTTMHLFTTHPETGSGFYGTGVEESTVKALPSLSEQTTIFEKSTKAGKTEATGKPTSLEATTESKLEMTTTESELKSTSTLEGQKPTDRRHTEAEETTFPKEQQVSITSSGYQTTSAEEKQLYSTESTALSTLISRTSVQAQAGREDFGYGGGNEITEGLPTTVVEASPTASSELPSSTEETNIIETSVSSESPSSTYVEYMTTSEISSLSTSAEHKAPTPEVPTAFESLESSSTTSSVETTQEFTPFSVTQELTTKLEEATRTTTEGQKKEIETSQIIPVTILTGAEEFGYGGGAIEPSSAATVTSKTTPKGRRLLEISAKLNNATSIATQLYRSLLSFTRIMQCFVIHRCQVDHVAGSSRVEGRDGDTEEKRELAKLHKNIL
ncbi:unnamed protein product, partial [Gongylonema pulchrum]|uniref:CSPG2 protein n=1 Tax=Gongylonema pulchrum TaxID=637853 RepID=A0A183D3R8_9BILA